MADQPTLRVLFRCHFGLPYRQGSEEERTKTHELARQMFEKWKSSGVKLIGTFSCSSHVDGFAHHIILEVDDVRKVVEMDNDIFSGEVGKYMENFQFHIGWPGPGMEEIWQSS